MISPDLDFCNRVNRDIEDRKTIVLVCSCSIKYDGRSKSTIGDGHRIITIKPDSTLLVHSVSGFKPVNWMASPTETVAELSEGKIILDSQRTKKPFEEMKITVSEVLGYDAYEGLADDEKLDLTHTEKELSDYLSKNPSLVHPNFRLKCTEYNTPLGFIDLYGMIGDRCAFAELKVERAGLPAALQTKRYKDWLSESIPNVYAILVAPSITPNAMQILKKENIEFKKINIHELDIKRKKYKTLKEWIAPYG